MLKKTFALSLAIAMVLPMLPVLPFSVQEVNAAAPAALAVPAAPRNLLVNPGFEDGLSGWTVAGTTSQTQLVHSGKFATNSGFNNTLQQEVTAPYRGYYNTSAYIATGSTNNTTKFVVKKSATGLDATTYVVPPVVSGTNFLPAYFPSTPVSLAPILLEQGEKVKVHLTGGGVAGRYTRSDDFSFTYDMTRVDVNLMNTSSAFNQMVKLPRTGTYKLTANVSGSDQVTVVAGTVTTTVYATATPQPVTLSIPDLAVDTELNISATPGATVTNFSLLYDIGNAPKPAPSAEGLYISGLTWPGNTLTANYTFVNPNDYQYESGSTFKWLVSDSPDGFYTEIAGQTGKTLVLTDNELGKHIKFEVTPMDNFSGVGTAVQSVPESINANLISNYNMSGATDPQAFIGWKASNGASFREGLTSNGEAKSGMYYISMPANVPDAEASMPLTINKTAVYDVSMHIKNATGTVLGIRIAGSKIPLREMTVGTGIPDYLKVTLRDVLLEKDTNVELYVKGGATTMDVSIDDAILTECPNVVPQKSANILSFKAEKQLGNATIDTVNRTVEFQVPYGTNVSSLDVVDLKVSEGATVSPSTTDINFANPVTFTISNGSVNNEWTIKYRMEKAIALESSNQGLENNFNWAVNKTKQFVMTGKSNMINKHEGTAPIIGAPGTGPVNYIPSYWAGYYDRAAFYGRDFVHQATGGQIAGLANENFSMFKAFADKVDAAKVWYTIWAINFDGTPFNLDYKTTTNFVREVPAQFELVQRAYEQYRWTGDARYINDPSLLNFYTKSMNEFITSHDSLKANGLAEGTGLNDIFKGSSTYNERGTEHPIESGDSVGSQYQATLAYAGILEARGDLTGAETWRQKAADLKTYFNTDWSVIAGATTGEFARGLAADGTKYGGFGKENSWFMPMKLITEPGQRNNDYMAMIENKLGTGIGSTAEAPANIEAYTYIPDMYFPYNKADLAWKWMKYIMSVRDNNHERPTQGTNGDYPEISFTYVSQVIEGMMGIEPDAGAHKVITAPRLPLEVNDVTAKYIPVGEHEITVKHEGLTKTTLTNISTKDLTWEVRFYGDFNNIVVGDQAYEVSQKNVNGVKVSYAEVTVPANGTLEATAIITPVDTITVTMRYAALNIGDHGPATATVTPTNATMKDVLWSLEDDGGHATINALTGDVTAVSVGVVKVVATAKDGSGVRGVYTLEIHPAHVNVGLIAISGDTNLTAGNSYQYTSAVTPTEATNKTVAWTVVNETGVATISESGLLQAVTAGTVTLKATATDGSGVFTVKTVTIANAVTPPSNSGGDGGSYTPPVTTTPVSETKPEDGIKLGEDTAKVSQEVTPEGKSYTNVVLDGEKLVAAFEQLKNKGGKENTVVIEVKGNSQISKVDLPASALASATANTMLSIKSGTASYELPMAALDLGALSKELGADLKDVKITIKMEKITGQAADRISTQAKERGATMLSAAIEFSVTVVAGDKKIQLNTFGSTYISREIIVDGDMNSNAATGVMIDPASGEFTFIPTIIVKVDGKTHVTMKRPGNSTYAVVQGTKTFDDLNGHWAKSYIDLLASKFIINGQTATSFNPNGSISRAEFAALIVRSLGLTKDAAGANFSDVSSSDWFAGAVGAAVKAGVVNGLEDGSFAPNSPITRQEMAVMIAKALKFAGKSVDGTTVPAQILEKFTDHASIAVWAQASVEQAVAAGIISGLSDNTLAPGDNATRAEAAKMLKQLLQYTQFID